jgi:hypothetical protein
MPVHRPKIKEKLFFVFSGAIISTPFPALVNSLASYFLRQSYPLSLATFASVVIIAPILEEFAKIYPLFYRHLETERSIFILGFLAGLGFGIAEFFLYAFILNTPIVIRLPLVLFHATNTSVAAYGIAKQKPFLFFLLAVIIHSANNIFSQFGGIWFAGLFIPVMVSYIVALFLYRLTEEKTIIGDDYDT